MNKVYMVRDKKTGLYLRKPVKHFLGLPIPDFSTVPRIETYTSKGFKNKTAWIYATPNYEYKVIYIPEGSMIMDYNIDLQ